MHGFIQIIIFYSMTFYFFIYIDLRVYGESFEFVFSIITVPLDDVKIDSMKFGNLGKSPFL